MSVFAKLSDTFWDWASMAGFDSSSSVMEDTAQMDMVLKTEFDKEEIWKNRVWAVDEEDEMRKQWGAFEESETKKKWSRVEDKILAGDPGLGFSVNRVTKYFDEIKRFVDDDGVREVIHGHSWGRHHYYYRADSGKLYDYSIKDGAIQSCAEVSLAHIMAHVGGIYFDDTYQEFNSDDIMIPSSVGYDIMIPSGAGDDNMLPSSVEDDKCAVNRVPSWTLMDIQYSSDPDSGDNRSGEVVYEMDWVGDTVEDGVWVDGVDGLKVDGVEVRLSVGCDEVNEVIVECDKTKSPTKKKKRRNKKNK
jgi:hypothetical protein